MLTDGGNEGLARRDRVQRSAAGDRAVYRKRMLLQEITGLVEATLASAGVLTLMAIATLLLIRLLGR